jgi:hypothetical protein
MAILLATSCRAALVTRPRIWLLDRGIPIFQPPDTQTAGCELVQEGFQLPPASRDDAQALDHLHGDRGFIALEGGICGVRDIAD